MYYISLTHSTEWAREMVGKPKPILCDPLKFRLCPKKNVKNDVVRTRMSQPKESSGRKNANLKRGLLTS